MHDTIRHPFRTVPDEKIILLLHDPATSSLGANLCYRKYEPFCLRVAASWTNDAGVACEVAHDVLAHFIEREIDPALASFRSGTSISAYLAAAIRNAFRSSYRRRQRQNTSGAGEADDLLPSIASPEISVIERLIANEQETIVQRCVDTLAPIEAEVLTLRYVDELTLQEIADRLGLVPSTVSYRIKKALVHLRQCVEASGVQGGNS